MIGSDARSVPGRSAKSGVVPILRASGAGDTALAAFHRALVSVGVGHYNLVRLSSVIPPGVAIDATGALSGELGSWGDRLYCVYAEQRASTPGQEAWAGIGWVQRLGDGGGGLLVEHEGGSEAFVTHAITSSLNDMVRNSDEAFSEPAFVLNGVLCEVQPVCSLVIAPFQVIPWHHA